MDRRIIRDRISKLKKDLIHLGKVRKTQRKMRENVLQVALVGYTNAGKTTLMNGLTDSELLVEDKLFATLDSTVKILNPNNRPKILISDTVGFIDKLPHKLVASFKSTLDELFSADLMLHVVDVSSENYEKNIEVTHKVLDELQLSEKPSFIVFNKSDLLTEKFLLPKILKRKYLESVVVSALDPESVVSLRTQIIDHFERKMMNVELEIPYALQEKISEIHEVSKIIDKKYNETSVYLKFKIANMHFDRLALSKYQVGDTNGTV
jgi:GTP-binding protein HflX